MLKQKEFEKNLQQLKNSAINRKTQQGIKVYDWALDSLSKASSEDEFNNILKKVKNALGGIEAHGEFTDEEFQAVTSIRQIDAF